MVVGPEQDGPELSESTYLDFPFPVSCSGTLEDVRFAFYLVPAAGSSVEVSVADFRRVLVSGV